MLCGSYRDELMIELRFNLWMNEIGRKV